MKRLQGVVGSGWWNGLWSWAGACCLGPFVLNPYTVKGTLGHPSKGLGIHPGGAWGKAELPWLGALRATWEHCRQRGQLSYL